MSASASARIFVQVASYRDPDLLSTRRECLAAAAHPERLRVGPAWQRDEEETLAELAVDPRVRAVTCHWRESHGTCWARRELQRRYDGEDTLYRDLRVAGSVDHSTRPGYALCR